MILLKISLNFNKYFCLVSRILTNISSGLWLKIDLCVVWFVWTLYKRNLLFEGNMTIKNTFLHNEDKICSNKKYFVLRFSVSVAPSFHQIGFFFHPCHTSAVRQSVTSSLRHRPARTFMHRGASRCRHGGPNTGLVLPTAPALEGAEAHP